MVRSAAPAHVDLEHSSHPFATQLALARVHPALAPVRAAGDSYVLDHTAAQNWFALQTARGLAGYGLARALRMLLDVLAGLTALHETKVEGGVGFVHGEVVPALIRVDAQGIARLLPLAAWHTRPMVVLSPESVDHLAPERLLGDAMDCRADVYSAGVMLWEALAGKRLFERDSVDEIITRLMGGKVLLPELPPELAWAIPLKAVAMRALSVDPEQRFADCPEFAAAIEAVARRQIASHAQVLAHFAAPARLPRPVAPGLPRAPAHDAEFRSSHKSSLSALVTPSAFVSQSAEFEVDEAPSPRGRARRAAWTVTALVSLCIGLGFAAFTHQNQIRAAAHEALPRAAVSSPTTPPAAAALAAASTASAASGAAPAASVVPLEPTTPAASESAAAPDVPRVTPDRVLVPVRGRDNKSRVAPSVNKPAAPAAPAKTPRIRDKEAEQYGI